MNIHMNQGEGHLPGKIPKVLLRMPERNKLPPHPSKPMYSPWNLN